MTKRNIRWTRKQELHLIELRKRNLSYKEIAEQMSRTPAACSAKHKELRERAGELLEVATAPHVEEPEQTEISLPLEPKKAEPASDDCKTWQNTMIAAFILFGAASAADLLATVLNLVAR